MNTPVLLQTTQAYVHKPDDPNHGMAIRLILDGGSQRSYITQQVKDALDLEPQRIEEVHIQTFGSDSTRSQMVEMVTVAVQPNKGSPIPMLFSTVPSICEPLSYQLVAYTKQCYGHLANLELADSSRVGDKLQIDALIGSNHYWQLVTGQIIQGDSGPTAIHTQGAVRSSLLCNSAA